jgi:hypothetical protein
MNLPQIIFKDNNDYLSKRNKMYDNIKETIDEWVIKDKFEYEHMSYQGLTSRQEINIRETLTNELNKFTGQKYDNWCNELSFNIILGIRGFLDGLIKIERITDFTAEEYAKLIYNSIIYQLDNDEYSHCLLDNISTILDNA